MSNENNVKYLEWLWDYGNTCQDCEDTPGRLHNNADPTAQSIDCPTCKGVGFLPPENMEPVFRVS